MANICIYYDNNYNIIEVLPKELDQNIRFKIYELWGNEIIRKILITVSRHEKISMQELKKKIGHSISTIYDYLKRLNDLNLVKLEKKYKEKKQLIITSKVICVTRNKQFKVLINKFFKGLWINSENMKKIIEFLRRNKDRYYTAEEISVNTNIPVDEVELLLSNWDSQLTRAVSDFLKEPPFEKKVLYKGK